MGSPAKVSEIPKGYRFTATDQEIIQCFLFNKVHGKPLPSNFVIECDLYGEEELWMKKFEETGEKTLYFFTKLKKKTEKGTRVERGTRCGTWKNQSNEKINLHVDKNQEKHIGSIRKFTLVPKEGLIKAKGRWVMHEYRLDGILLDQTHHNDYVFCRVKKKKEKENTTSDFDKPILETMFPATGGVQLATGGVQQMEQILSISNALTPAMQEVQHMEQMVINNTSISEMQGVQQMEQMERNITTGQSDLVDNMDSFVEQLEDMLSSPISSKPSLLNLAETETEVQTQVSLMSHEVLVSKSVPESTYPLSWGSHEFIMTRADADNMDSFLPRADADNTDSFMEEIEALLSSPIPSMEIEELLSSPIYSMEPRPLNGAEAEVQTQVSVMPPEVLASKSVPEATYPLAGASNEFTLPRADADQLKLYNQQQEAVLMNDSFWGIPDSQKDDWLRALNNALNNYNPHGSQD